jgi:hypothetical protein
LGRRIVRRQKRRPLKRVIFHIPFPGCFGVRLVGHISLGLRAASWLDRKFYAIDNQI